MQIDSTMKEIVKLLSSEISEGSLFSCGKREKLEQIIAMYALSAMIDSLVAKEVNYICASIKD